MDSLAKLLPALVRHTDDSAPAREAAVFAAWSSVAGGAVRHVAAPIRYDNSLLVVSTVDLTWRTQLERLASQYIFRINSLLGAPMVRRINFNVDAAAVAAYEKSVFRPPVEPIDAAPYARELSSDAEVIEDPELREAFLRAASKCMARTEKGARAK
jgi:hypothetical protein